MSRLLSVAVRKRTLTLKLAPVIIGPQWSWYTGRWWVGCYVWYSEEGTGRGRSPSRPLLAVLNVTVYPSTASVPITVLLYNDLCGFNVPVKGSFAYRCRWTENVQNCMAHARSVLVRSACDCHVVEPQACVAWVWNFEHLWCHFVNCRVTVVGS